MTSNKTTKNNIKETNSKEKTTSIKSREKNFDKDARKKWSELTDNPERETDNPLKVGNVYRFLKVKGIEKYKVNDK